MPTLAGTLHAWGTPQFKDVAKREIEAFGRNDLPLQQGLSLGNHVTDDRIAVSINSATATDTFLQIRAGVFYQSLIAGCSCADDPTPISNNNEYCEIQLDIDKTTSIATVTLLS
ncbi:MAG: hypothetical protein WA632_07660 [Gallionella sp.]